MPRHLSPTQGRHERETAESGVRCLDAAWPGAPAGWGQRFAAFLLDGVLVVIALSLVLAPTGIERVQGWELLAAAIAMLMLPLYFALSEGVTGGMTIGKRVLRVAVRKAETLTVTQAQYCCFEPRPQERLGDGRALGVA